MISIEDAQLHVWQAIHSTLLDLAIEEDTTPEEVEDLDDAMADATDLIIEALDLQVTDVGDGAVGTATVDITPLETA